MEAPPEPGIGRLARLNKLNISTRNCARMRSVIGVFFTTAKSTTAKPGPNNALRARFPNVPGAGGAKASRFRYCTYLVPSAFVMTVWLPPLYGSPTRSTRSRPSKVPLTFRPA